MSAMDSKGSLHSATEHCLLRASRLGRDTDLGDGWPTLNPNLGPTVISFCASFSSFINFGGEVTPNSQYCHRDKIS